MPKSELNINNDCSKCKKKYQLTDESAVLHWYKKRPYLANLEMICPGCENVEFLFIEEDWRDAAFGTSWPRKVHEDGEDWLIEAWEILNYKLMVPDAELIPRHEGLVWDLAILLDTTPHDWLMEVFSTPASKPTMPPSWR